MSFVKSLILGRENGVRAGLRKKLLGETVEDTSPTSSFSAPRDEPMPEPAEAALGLQPEPPRDVTPPAGYEVVLHRDALSVGHIAEIIIGGTAIAIANVEGEFHACQSSCPDGGGPLADGELNGPILTSPYDGWKFDLRDGSCSTRPDTTLKIHEVQVVDNAVCVKI